MGECNYQEQRIMGDKAAPTLDPQTEAGFLKGLYELHLKPPTNDSCAQARTDAFLAQTLSTVRNKGADYSNQVFTALDQRNPEVSQLLKECSHYTRGTHHLQTFK
jgi:hypothetical protein